MYFSQYFKETFHLIDAFTTQQWLEFLDDDSIEMLLEYTNHFSSDLKDELVDMDKVKDVFELTKQLIIHENSQLKLEDKNVQSLCGMIIMERLRRKNLISYNGSGTLYNEDIQYCKTKLGELAYQQNKNKR